MLRKNANDPQAAKKWKEIIVTEEIKTIVARLRADDKTTANQLHQFLITSHSYCL